MIKVIKKESATGCTNGTYKVGSLTGVSYWDLKKAFGEPTHSTPSGDDKVQKEWVFEFEDKNFTGKAYAIGRGKLMDINDNQDLMGELNSQT